MDGPRIEFRDCPVCGSKSAVQCDIGTGTVTSIPDDPEWTQARVEDGFVEGMRVEVLLKAVCVRCKFNHTDNETFRWKEPA